MSLLPSFAWPEPELVKLLGVEFVKERVKALVAGYTSLCGSLQWSADPWVDALVGMSDAEVLKVVGERRRRVLLGDKKAYEVGRDRRESEIFAERGEAEIRMVEKWTREREGRVGVRKPHMEKAVVDSRVARMVAENELALEATRKVREAVRSGELDAHEALRITAVRVTTEETRRSLGVGVGGTSGRGSVRKKSSVGSGSSSGSWRVPGKVSEKPARAGGSVFEFAKRCEDEVKQIEGIEAGLAQLRTLVQEIKDGKVGMSYVDSGGCEDYRDDMW